MVKIGGEESSCWRGYSFGETRTQGHGASRLLRGEKYAWSCSVTQARESKWEEDNGLVECRYSEEHKHKEPVDPLQIITGKA